MEKYDKRKTYDAVIAEKVKELSALCYQNGIPAWLLRIPKTARPNTATSMSVPKKRVSD